MLKHRPAAGDGPHTLKYLSNAFIWFIFSFFSKTLMSVFDHGKRCGSHHKNTPPNIDSDPNPKVQTYECPQSNFWFCS